MQKENQKRVRMLSSTTEQGKTLLAGFCYWLPADKCKRLVDNGDATLNLHPEEAKTKKKAIKKG